MKIELVTGMLAAFPFLMGIAASSPLPEVSANYGKLPLSFEPNQGQTDAQVRFVAHGPGYTIFLSPTSATFALRPAVIRMDLLAANPDSRMLPSDKLPGVTNYLMGSTRTKWPTNLPTYAKTRVQNIYPGIDLIYYGTQGQLEYDFVLAPQADPSRIRLKFAGANPVIDQSGDLILPHGGIRFHKPVLYQQVDGVREPVNGGFKVAANKEVSFQISRYDHGRELIIDPVLAYSSYLGGSSQQSVINGMTVNAAGQIYVTGVTNAIDFRTTPGVIQGACPPPTTGGAKCGPSSASAAFVSKISADGRSLIYSTYLGGGGSGPGVGGATYSQGGSGSDFGTAIAVDANDNAWVLGGTNSNNFPVTANAYSLYCEPASASFDFNTGQNVGELSACARFNAGGEFNYSGSNSLFLVKLNPTGTTILYGTFLGGTQGEIPGQIALDAAGHIYISGTARNGANGTPAATGQYPYPTTASAFQPIAQASAFAPFVTELSADGRSLVYSSFLSATNGDTFGGPLALGAGKVFIGGVTRTPTLPTTPGALSSTCPGSATQCALNGFVAEFDPAKSGPASLVFSTYLNGKHVSSSGITFATSTVSALAADASGNVYAAGSTQYLDFPTTSGVLQPTCNSTRNDSCSTGFVTKLSPAGALVWSTFYGSPSASGQFGVSAIALDAGNNVYITNPADGAGDLPLKNPFQDYTSGVAYVTELSSDASQVLFGSFFGSALIFPTGIVVDAAGSIYLTGYTAGALPLVNALQSTNAGGFPEGFFAKISSPSIAVTSVANAESESPVIAPNTWVEIKGSSLAPAGDTRTWQGSDFVNNQLPTQLDGVAVTMNGKNAYVYYISPSQVNVLTPPDVAAGPVQVQVTSGGVTSAAFTAQAQQYSLSFFVFGGGPYVVGTHLNGSDLGPASLYPGLTTPAQPGELIMLYANGFGPTSPPVVAGSTAQSGNLPALPVIQIGGITATVQFAGVVSPGLYQINVSVPSSAPNGDDAITVQYNGLTTQTGVLLTVQH